MAPFQWKTVVDSPMCKFHYIY